MNDFSLVVIAAFFGMATHVLVKLVKEKNATGRRMTPARLRGFIRDYFLGNALELLLMVFFVIGGLVLALALNELTVYAAYLTGYSGNSMGEVIGHRAEKMAARISGR